MSFKSLLILVFLSGITFTAESQRLKVKRKGVTPPEANKNVQTNNSNYTLQQLSGKWQEISRRESKSSTPAAFNDTLFYNFFRRKSI